MTLSILYVFLRRFPSHFYSVSVCSTTVKVGGSQVEIIVLIGRVIVLATVGKRPRALKWLKTRTLN